MMILLLSSCSRLSSSERSGNTLYVMVHFTNHVRNISYIDLQKVLRGEARSFHELGGERRPIRLYIDRAVADDVSKRFPHCRGKIISLENSSSVRSERGAMILCGMESVEPCFRLLYVDYKLPWGSINKDYTLSGASGYPLMAGGSESSIDDNIITVVQTGVTAMTRAFMREVEKRGNLSYPIKYSKGITGQADLAMTSNEVSFLDPCTYPFKDNLSFCSPKKYFNILIESGFDVIEVTGNHNNDYGYRYNRDTLKMITKKGMIYFGGGINKSDAEAIRYRKVRDQVIAFIGFNELGPPKAWAGRNRPGALKLSERMFRKMILEARGKSDIVFVSVQWGNENDPKLWKKQVRYSHLAADLGATIIVSSSAHRAMGVEFYRKRFISYGLGNFLFDQMHTINHRRGMIARHIFFRGRHIQTELIPYLIQNYSQPRPVYGRQARELFDYVYRYSRGDVFGKRGGH